MGKIKIIIVDDELAARNTVKGFLRDSPAYEVSADFSGGKKALEWLRDNHADIAVCDMNMPQIDGVEFIAMAMTLCPDLHFIALSGYSDFRYLRECIVKPVEDYLLKHELTSDALINALEKIRRKYVLKPVAAEGSPPGRYVSYADFTAEKLRELAGKGLADIIPDSVTVFIISPDYNPAAYPGYRNFLSGPAWAARDIIAGVLENRCRYVMNAAEDGGVTAVLSLPASGTAQPEEIIRNLYMRIQDRLGRLLNISATIGVSGCGLSIEDVLARCPSSLSFKDAKLYRDMGTVFSLKEAAESSFGAFTLPPYIDEQIRMVMELKDSAGASMICKNLFREMARVRCAKAAVIDICRGILEKAGGGEENKTDLSCFEFIVHFEDRIRGVLEKRIGRLQKDENAACSVTVSRAIAYTEEHFKEDISLEDCAGCVGVSYTHLSRIFRQETGRSFSDYLSRFRVGKAKLFLAEKNLPIKEIVDKSGFRNYNYFFKVFKDIEGITPNEYVGRVYKNSGRG